MKFKEQAFEGAEYIFPTAFDKKVLGDRSESETVCSSACLQRPTCLNSILEIRARAHRHARAHMHRHRRTHTDTLRNCSPVSVHGKVDVNLLSRSYIKETIPLINAWLYSVLLV